MRMFRCVNLFIVCAISLAIVGCGGGDHKDHSHKDHDHKDHAHKDESKDGKKGHHHEARFGGALVGLGEHKAHIEFKIDTEQKKFFMYIWDGEVENPIRVKQPSVDVQIEGGAKLTLEAQASENTGEKVGDSSTFACEVTSLGGKTEFDATLISLAIQGKTYTDVRFNYPRGSEE